MRALFAIRNVRKVLFLVGGMLPQPCISFCLLHGLCMQCMVSIQFEFSAYALSRVIGL
jgi:hypothetical protein